MIQSVFFGGDAEMIDRILRLHRSGDEILDASFGHGRFWASLLPMDHELRRKITGIDLRMDSLDPASCNAPNFNAVKATWECLPFRNAAFDAVICDPPFISRAGKSFVMTRRYSSSVSYDALLISLQRAFEEFDRVLKPQSIVVVKIMDLTEGRRRMFAHIDLANAVDERFRLDDLFIKIAPQTMDSSNWKTQLRSRAAHSYFMVFKRRRKARSGEASPAPSTEAQIDSDEISGSTKASAYPDVQLSLASEINDVSRAAAFPRSPTRSRTD